MLLVRDCPALGHCATLTRPEFYPWTSALTVILNQRGARWWKYPQRGSWDHASYFLPLGSIPKTGCPLDPATLQGALGGELVPAAFAQHAGSLGYEDA